RMPHAGHYFRPAVEVVGDLGLILEELAPRLRRKSRADWDMALVDRLKRERRACLAVSTAGLAPQRVVEIARELAPGGTVATVDAGAHMFPATTFWESEEPGTFLISNGLSSMGFALPAAIAAQLAYPSRRVVCLAGDGGLLMVAAELETAVRLRLPIVIVVFNDRALSLIQVKQEQKGYGSSEMSYTGPDFAPLARSFGMPAFEAETEEEFRSAMSQALAAGAPALVDARIDASGYRQILETIRGAPRA
ncbi:MAG: thiamine pyrophosphate-dependent enzyme, partial [Candidatus Methylomirabilia bacterium]